MITTTNPSSTGEPSQEPNSDKDRGANGEMGAVGGGGHDRRRRVALRAAAAAARLVAAQVLAYLLRRWLDQ